MKTMMLDIAGMLFIASACISLLIGLGFYIHLACLRARHSTCMHVGILHYTTKRLGHVAYGATDRIPVFIPLAILYTMALNVETLWGKFKAKLFNECKEQLNNLRL